MSVQESKQAFKRSDEEIWIKGNFDLLDETLAETITSGGESIRRQDWKALARELSSKPGGRTVRVEYHEMIGEGEKLAVWQTNHYEDGSKVSGVSIVEYSDGREIRHEWLPLSDS